MNRALDAAALSLTGLAEEAELHHVTLRRWRSGDRGVDPESALKVAGVLRRRTKRLARLADELEQIARAEREGRG